MDKEKIQINLAPGQPVTEVIWREGVAARQLEPKAPVKTNLEGVIGCVAEYLAKRIDTGQFEQKDCHILVNRDKVEITLITNETDGYRRGEIVGRLEYNSKFLAFRINTGQSWTPTELGLFAKMNRTFFTDRTSNMELVSKLMNFTATVNNSIDRAVAENGSRSDCFTQVVNSNLPESFLLQIPIFKGMSAETIEVETFAQVNGREVSFVLMSPGAQATLEDLRDKVIDNELDKIRDIAPDIAIIEV